MNQETYDIALMAAAAAIFDYLGWDRNPAGQNGKYTRHIQDLIVDLGVKEGNEGNIDYVREALNHLATAMLEHIGGQPAEDMDNTNIFAKEQKGTSVRKIGVTVIEEAGEETVLLSPDEAWPMRLSAHRLKDGAFRWLLKYWAFGKHEPVTTMLETKSYVTRVTGTGTGERSEAE